MATTARTPRTAEPMPKPVKTRPWLVVGHGREGTRRPPGCHEGNSPRVEIGERPADLPQRAGFRCTDPTTTRHDPGFWKDVGVTVEAFRSGIDLSYVDSDARPQDDLFGHVNGRWLAEYKIPADRATDGDYRCLHDRAEEPGRDRAVRAATAATSGTGAVPAATSGTGAAT